MIKKTVTTENLFTGESETKDYYFNLTEAELTELQMSVEGGLSEHLKTIQENKDIKAAIEFFKTFVLMAYCEKNDNGGIRKLNKNGEKLANDFACSEAYSKIFIELATNEDAANDFVNNVSSVKPKQA